MNGGTSGERIDVGGLWRVLQELEAGTLAPEERDELMVLLDKSPAARVAYLEYFEQASMLHAEAATHAEHGMLPVLEEPRRARRIFRRSVLAAAAVLALSAAIAALIAVRQPEPGRLAAAVAAETMWAVDGEARDAGSDEMMVAEGSTVRVFSGTVKLRLESGARMVVQGPAEVAFPQLERPVLKQGWLWIDSGGADESLLVETPELLVRDIGTRFGVRVRDDGLAEVHLIEGMVEVTSKRTEKQLAVLEPDESGVLLPDLGGRTALSLARDPFPGLPDLLAAPANYMTTVLSQGPVGYWRLNDLDHGKIGNEIPEGTAGHYADDVKVSEPGVGPADGFYGFGDGNQSARLDGESPKSTLHMLDSPGGVSMKEGAVAFWFRRAPGIGREEVLWFAGVPIAVGLGQQDAMHAHLSSSGRVRFFMENGKFDVLLDSTRNVADGHWHHVAASWGSAAVELYVDGQQVDRDDEFRVSQDRVFSGTNVRFGKTGSNPSPDGRRMKSFIGWVDEIALWNHPLTTYEVSHQFQSARGKKGE